MPASAYRLLRPLLHRLDAERAHDLAIGSLRLLGPLASPPSHDPRLQQSLLGRRFPAPIGLAAGFDKDALAARALPLLGFGFLELGTVTPLPQAGNPRPRLFRHPEAESLRNAMGFNNRGGRALARRLRRLHPFALPLGVNVGKNRDTPDEEACDDYWSLIDTLSDRCDYFVVNLSSPNTPGLRELQNERFVRRLLAGARELTDRPLLVKISPDLPAPRAVGLSLEAVEAGAAGVVIANTTTDYAALPGAGPPGGLSGRALTEKSFALLDAVAAELHGRALLISVGGIAEAGEVYRRLRAGAALVQLYTALVYAGPGLVRRLHRELLELLDRDGLPGVEAAVGIDR